MTNTNKDTKKEIKKLVRIHRDGVEIIDDELFKKVSKGKLSASMANSLLACPADWFLDKYILRDLEHDEQPALERGTLFHEIMELFFRVPADMRNPEVIGAITMSVIETSFPHLLSNEDTIAWVKSAVLNYLSMGFDFKNEIIPNITWKGRPQTGLELFVNGDLGGATSREIVGFVDKIVETEVDGKTITTIEDWKTGRNVQSFDPNKPISQNNSFDYWRQQTLYAMLMEEQGFEIDNARLIFPVAKKIVDIDFKREDIRKQVIDDMVKVDERLDRCLEKNFFPFTPAQWCTWCHLLYAGKKKGRARYPQVNQNQLNQIVEFVEY